MANTFEFVGCLRPIKSEDSDNGLIVKTYDSGWMTKRLRFSIVEGTNRHFVEINGGRWSQEDKNTLYLQDKDRNNFQIPWDKRNDAEVVEKTAGWRVYTVDTETYSHRKELRENGELEALAKADAKKKHFLDKTEFCNYVHRVVNSEKGQQVKFRIKGNINYNYSEKNDTYYETYEVNKIYRVDEDEKEFGKVNVEFYFDENAFDDSMFEEYGKAMVSGYTPFYNSQTKTTCYCPISLVMRDKKQANGFGNKVFNGFEDEEIRKVNLECNKISGAQRIEVTYDDLSDEVKENIDLGLTTLEDAIADVGGSMFGERITELRISKLGRGSSSGSETTTFTLADVTRKPIAEKSVVKDIVKEEEDTDLPFDLDDDDL